MSTHVIIKVKQQWASTWMGDRRVLGEVWDVSDLEFGFCCFCCQIFICSLSLMALRLAHVDQTLFDLFTQIFVFKNFI